MRKVLLTFEVHLFKDADDSLVESAIEQADAVAWDVIDEQCNDIGRVVNSWSIVGPNTEDGNVK